MVSVKCRPFCSGFGVLKQIKTVLTIIYIYLHLSVEKYKE